MLAVAAAPASTPAAASRTTATDDRLRETPPLAEATSRLAATRPAAPEVRAPAPVAGFLPELPLPLQFKTPELAATELEFAVILSPELPRREPDAAPNGSAVAEAPVAAGSLRIAISSHGANCGPAIRITGVDVRESHRTSPVTVQASVLEVQALRPSSLGSDESLAEWTLRDTPLSFSIPSQPPGPTGQPWLSNAEEFTPPEIELGGLARLALATDGIRTDPHGFVPGQTAALPDQLNTVPSKFLTPAFPAEPQQARAAPMSIEPSRQDLSSLAHSAAARSSIEPVHVEPVQVDPTFLQSLANLELSPVQESAPEPSLESAGEGRSDLPGVTPEPSAPPAPAIGPEPSVSVPERATQPLPLTLHGLPPGRGKRAQIFMSALRPELETQIPSTGTFPLRPVMLFGPTAGAAPSHSASQAHTASQASSATPSDEVAAPPRESRSTTAEPRKTEERAAIRNSAAVKPEPRQQPKPDTNLEPKAEQPPEPKLSLVKPSQPRSPELLGDAMLGMNVLPSPARPAAASVDLGLPTLQMDPGGKSRMPAPAVLVVVLVVVAAIGAGVYKLGGQSAKQAPAAPAAPVTDVVETGAPLAVAEAGWIEDWAPQPPNPKVMRVLSILRGSLPLSDYRMEFEAQIEAKALGWVFRALNQNNYYVTKLEVVKPGIEPAVDVVHFAMIDGVEQTRSRAPLPIKVRVDTSYKVRFEALGDRFTTYIQGQKVDEWTDNRIGRGGVGLYRERGESALLKGTVRMTLIAQKK